MEGVVTDGLQALLHIYGLQIRATHKCLLADADKITWEGNLLKIGATLEGGCGNILQTAERPEFREAGNHGVADKGCTEIRHHTGLTVRELTVLVGIPSQTDHLHILVLEDHIDVEVIVFVDVLEVLPDISSTIRVGIALEHDKCHTRIRVILRTFEVNAFKYGFINWQRSYPLYFHSLEVLTILESKITDAFYGIGDRDRLNLSASRESLFFYTGEFVIDPIKENAPRQYEVDSALIVIPDGGVYGIANFISPACDRDCLSGGIGNGITNTIHGESCCRDDSRQAD